MRPEPGGRQPGESAKAFAAFVAYRDAGDDRTHALAAEAVQKSQSLMATWSAKWNWRERIAEWDEHIDKQARRRTVHAARRARARHCEMAELLGGLVKRQLLEFNRGWDEYEAGERKEPPHLSPETARLWLVTSVQIERQAYGQVDERIEIVNRGAQDDWLDAALASPDAALAVDALAKVLARESRGDGGAPDPA